MPFDPATGAASLADLLAMVEADPGLKPSQRAQRAWALRTAAKYLGKPLEALPARLTALRYGIGRLHPVQLGVKRKTFDNWRSAFAGAVRHYGGAMGLPRRGTRLAPEWQALHDGLPDPHMRRGLVRLMRYCTAQGIGPSAVSDAVLVRFRAALEAETFSTRINTVHRHNAVLWNRAVGTVPGWPNVRLSVPDYRPPRQGLSRDELPESFRQDVDAYLASKTLAPTPGAGISALLDGPLAHPWAPRTAGLRREHIRLAASAAVHTGTPVEQLQHLADLTEPQTAKRILGHYLARDAKELGRDEPKTFTIDLAYTLLSIARDWIRPSQADLERLRQMSGNLERYRRSGLTEKNLTVIRALMDPANKARLKALPERLMEEAAKSHMPYRGAVTAQLAVAIAILIVAPMRIGNLVRLRVDVELLRPGGAKAPYHIHFPKHMVKNQVDLEYPLPAHTTRLIDRYRTQFRPRLVNAASDWLLPGEAGHKEERTLSGQLTKRVFAEIGIRITPHQFRHAAAAWLLQADPGNFELVRRILGHEDIATTVRFYIGLESISAMRRYHGIITSDPGEEQRPQ
jgi:integrase